MSGVTPEMFRVKVEEGNGQEGSPDDAAQRVLPRSLKAEADVADITADIERLLVLDTLVKPLELEMKPHIDRVKDHMAQTYNGT